MKSIKLFFAVAVIGLVITSCQTREEVQTVLIDFEDVKLDSTGYLNGSNGLGSFVSGPANFVTNFTQSQYFSFWSGFACSSNIDSVTPGYVNQYSVIAAKGATDSKQFAVAYDTAIVKINFIDHYYKIKNMMITNSTYAYKAMLNGTDFSHPFSNASDNGNGDWFKVKITGLFESHETGTVDYYLADFRNGKSFISKTWEKVDLSTLGQVDELMITFDSSDKSFGYMNNPAYACIDNIQLEYANQPL